jgi:hypothetical protein
LSSCLEPGSPEPGIFQGDIAGMPTHSVADFLILICLNFPKQSQEMGIASTYTELGVWQSTRYSDR